jgi:hypothetical protein
MVTLRTQPARLGFRRLDSRPHNGLAPTDQLDAHEARPLFKAHRFADWPAKQVPLPAEYKGRSDVWVTGERDLVAGRKDSYTSAIVGILWWWHKYGL